MKDIYQFNKNLMYESKPFIKPIKNIDANFVSKYILNIILLFSLMTTTIVLLTLVFTHADVNIFTIRATSIFTGAWTLVFFVWWGLQTSQYFKLTKNKTKWLAVFSFLPIINFVMIGILAKLVKREQFNKWLGWPFSNNKFETNPNNYKTKPWYLNLATLIVMLPLFYFLFKYSRNDPFQDYHNIWFDGIHYFTIQTNLMCFIYVLIYVINPKINLFNNDSVLICLMSYIFVVSFTYNALIFPFTLKDLMIDDPQYIVKGMWSHAVNPFMFIGVGISNMYSSSKKNPNIRDYGTVLKFGMTVPSVYLIYTFLLPFMSNKSVYGPITNCNPGTPNDTPLFGLENGSPIMIIPILLFWFVFIGVITMFWRIKYAFNQKVLKALAIK